MLGPQGDRLQSLHDMAERSRRQLQAMAFRMLVGWAYRVGSKGVSVRCKPPAKLPLPAGSCCGVCGAIYIPTYQCTKTPVEVQDQ